MDSLCGLQNIGNTCYMNSALQIIVNCTVLTKVILSNNFISPKLNIFKKFLMDYKNNITINPIAIKNLVGEKNNQFLNFQQHDSHEFLISLIEIIEEEFKNESEINPNPITINGIKLQNLTSSIFDTTVSSIIYSEETGEKSKTKVGEKILSLPISKNDNTTLENCIDLYSKIEKLSGTEQWLSQKENRYIDAYKRLYLKSLPKYLLLQLKRFTFFTNSNKNNKDVKAPINFIIRNNSYQLRGIIYHIGGANGGHYVSVIFYNNKWHLCDDNSVNEISNIDQFLNKGYIYLYVKQK